jgi:hypothetical protein
LRVSLGVIALLFTPAARARAQAGENLEWHAPEGCPAAGQARAEVARLLGADPSALALRASVQIERISSQELRARVALQHGPAVREQVLRDADCMALTHAAALVVSMALEPAARRSSPQPSASQEVVAGVPRGAAVSSPQPSASQDVASGVPRGAGREPSVPLPPEVSQAEDAPAVAPAEVPVPPERIALPVPLPGREPSAGSPLQRPQLTAAVPRDRAEPALQRTAAGAAALRGFVALAGGVASGPLPGLAPWGMLSGGILTSQLRAALRLAYLPGQSALIAGAGGAGGRVSLASAAAELGWRLRWSALEVPLLVGLEAGLLRADATGVPDHAARSGGWLAAFLGSGLAYSWDRSWSIAARVEGLLALQRPKFALERAGSADSVVFHQPRLLGARVWLALELQLP